MGAWADLQISTSTLKGIAPADLVDRATGAFDPRRITADMLAAAKQRVVQALTPTWRTQMSQLGSAEAFMDVFAGMSDLSTYLQHSLAWAGLSIYYWQHRNGRDSRFADSAEYADKMLKESLRALVAYAETSADLDDAMEAALPPGDPTGEIDLGGDVIYSI